jgi:hypothetical protein
MISNSQIGNLIYFYMYSKQYNSIQFNSIQLCNLVFYFKYQNYNILLIEFKYA